MSIDRQSCEFSGGSKNGRRSGCWRLGSACYWHYLVGSHILLPYGETNGGRRGNKKPTGGGRRISCTDSTGSGSAGSPRQQHTSCSTHHAKQKPAKDLLSAKQGRAELAKQ